MAALAFGALLICGQSAAQVAPGTGPTGPIDIIGNKADRYDDKHLTVWSGDVEVVQNGARLVCDTLYIYSYAPGEGPDAQGKAKPAAAAKPAPASTAAPGDGAVGAIKQMVAEGHVFYVTQSQTVRGEHGVYDAEPDTITMTGNVVVVQGKNVAKGDKMIIDRKSGHTTMGSESTGRNNPNRVRGVFYNDNQGGQAQPGPAAAPAAKKP